MIELDLPVSAAALEAEAQVVHSVQILSWQRVVSQLSKVLSPQVLPPIACHRVITLGEHRGGILFMTKTD